MDIIGKRNLYFLISLIVIIPGIISMITHGFELGIDFKGGTEFQIVFDHMPSLAALQKVVSSQNVSGVAQLAYSGGHKFFIIDTLPLDPIAQKKFESALEAHFGPINQTLSSVQEIGPSVAAQIVQGGAIAILLAAICITLYLSWRFGGARRGGFSFGVSAILALLHDVFVLTGIFSILGAIFHLHEAEIDSSFLTAALTVVGFSVHDTIVIFDRIRENMRATTQLTFEQIVNLSIMQSLARSIITSFTVILVMLALYLYGGNTLKGFALALLIGIFSGTYSSIFNASPLLVAWRRWKVVSATA
jgi:preprotein translocase subunit SecF